MLAKLSSRRADIKARVKGLADLPSEGGTEDLVAEVKEMSEQRGFERIEVVNGENVEVFTGRWLIAPDSDETRAEALDYEDMQWDAGPYWGVARTERGRIAVTIQPMRAGSVT
jgi:hypothetical protein